MEQKNYIQDFQSKKTNKWDGVVSFKPDILLMDIETTGLDPVNGKIIQVYYKIINFFTKEVKLERNEYFNAPGFKENSVNKISLEEIKDKPEFENSDFAKELKLNLLKCVGDKSSMVFMAQYAPFEISWMEEKLDIDLSDIKVFDTRLVERFLLGPDKSNVSASLGATCKRRGITGFDNEHRGDNDANAMLEVSFQQYRELFGDRKCLIDKNI